MRYFLQLSKYTLNIVVIKDCFIDTPIFSHRVIKQETLAVNSPTVNLHRAHAHKCPWTRKQRLQRYHDCNVVAYVNARRHLHSDKLIIPDPSSRVSSFSYRCGGSLETSRATWLLDRPAFRSHYNKYIMSIFYILRRQNLKNTINSTLGHRACNFANFLNIWWIGGPVNRCLRITSKLRSNFY